MKTIGVRLKQDERSYPIYIGRGLLRQLGELCSRHNLAKRVAIISDENVAPLYGEQALSSLAAAGIQARLFAFPPGESSKTLAGASRLYDALIEELYDRQSAVVGLGGGMVGDLAGFVAATFLRGIPWVAVPTTLLAQVDASVGGKTGVNHPLGKNLIGAFHQPAFVLIDPDSLRTLPPRELHGGLVELVKTALVGDAALYAFFEQELAALLDGRVAPLERAIAGACRVKMSVVSEDEREAGLRRILNFGHTVGHALEAATGYAEFLHGEAVAWGMLAAIWLSWKRGLLPQGERRRIEAVLCRLPVPALPQLAPEEILGYVHHDKKASGGEFHFVFLEGIGAATVAPVEEKELLSALEHLWREAR